VVCSCCDFRDAADRQFTDAKAAKELNVYRRGRVGPTTRAIRDAVDELGLNNGSLLDIGGGFGPLTFELLERGMPRATIVDASSSYIAAARDEAARRGRSPAIEMIHGDVVQLEAAVPDASLVTLDRVVCCYPTYEPLLQLAARHAKHALALSYPRDRWFVHLGMWLENTRRARKTGFRTFVHPPQLLRQAIRRSGFELVRETMTLMWSIDVFVRSRPFVRTQGRTSA